MITAKQARELARPKFDEKATATIKKTLQWIDSLIRERAKNNEFRLGVSVETLNSYEVEQIKLRLRNRGFHVLEDMVNETLSIGWMKQ